MQNTRRGAPPSVFLRVGLVTWNNQDRNDGLPSKVVKTTPRLIYPRWCKTPTPIARTDTAINVTLADAPVFGAILLKGFCRLITDIKAHQTHRMRPSPMDLRHARKM
jgi:hypothetical protein